MISIVSNNMIRFNIKSIANYLLFPKNEVHYIGGAEILPAPLSSEEETLLLTHLDDDVLEARQTLIEHNLRLVVYIAKKFDNTGVSVEDLISIGTIGLIKAINTFKSDKNIKLATSDLYPSVGTDAPWHKDRCTLNGCTFHCNKRTCPHETYRGRRFPSGNIPCSAAGADGSRYDHFRTGI